MFVLKPKPTQPYHEFSVRNRQTFSCISPMTNAVLTDTYFFFQILMTRVFTNYNTQLWVMRCVLGSTAFLHMDVNDVFCNLCLPHVQEGTTPLCSAPLLLCICASLKWKGNEILLSKSQHFLRLPLPQFKDKFHNIISSLAYIARENCPNLGRLQQQAGSPLSSYHRTYAF